MKKTPHPKPKNSVLFVAGLGGLFTVVNLAHGQDWQRTSAPTWPWRTIACSADGAKLVASGWIDYGYHSSVPMPIYVSRDSGVTWTVTSAPTNAWLSVACSADGSQLIAAAGRPVEFVSQVKGTIFVSTNSGDTWMQTSAPNNSWTSVAS